LLTRQLCALKACTFAAKSASLDSLRLLCGILLSELLP
jgi:hypothetical protein